MKVRQRTCPYCADTTSSLYLQDHYSWCEVKNAEHRDNIDKLLDIYYITKFWIMDHISNRAETVEIDELDEELKKELR